MGALAQAQSRRRSDRVPQQARPPGQATGSFVAGGGVLYSRAEEALAEFAGYARIPVAETLGGKGAGPVGSPLNLGGLGVSGTPLANEVAREADLVISIGSRLTDYGYWFQLGIPEPDVGFIGNHVNERGRSQMCGPAGRR